jgi:hypothetical protein
VRERSTVTYKAGYAEGGQWSRLVVPVHLVKWTRNQWRLTPGHSGYGFTLANRWRNCKCIIVADLQIGCTSPKDRKGLKAEIGLSELSVRFFAKSSALPVPGICSFGILLTQLNL